MYFDVILIGDIRVPGGTSRQAANAIRILNSAGYSVGLVGVQLPNARGPIPIDVPIRRRIALGEAAVVGQAHRGDIEAGLVIFDNARAFMEMPENPIRIRARSAVTTVHFPVINGFGERTFEPATVDQVTGCMVDCEVRWTSMSRLAEKLLAEHHPELQYCDRSMPYVVFADEFRTSRRRPVADIPIVGRHSRPEKDKWPATRSDVLAVFPANSDVRVSLLGTGPYLKELMGSIPRNWSIHSFNEIAVPEFLRGIDFFLHYHHPRWIEAFGIASAEAMASGAVTILPPYMKENFGGGAMYCEPDEAIQTVLSLYKHWDDYLRQSRKGRAFVRRHNSPERFLDVASELIPPRPKGRGRGSESKTNRRFDIVMMADMSNPGADAMRMAEEIQIQVETGYRTALIHVPADGGESPVHPDIDRFVASGEVSVIDPRRERVATNLLVVHSPNYLLTNLSHLRWDVRAQRTVVVVVAPTKKPEAIALLARMLEKAYQGPVSFAPKSRGLRIFLEKHVDCGVIEPDDWRPVVSRIATESKKQPGGRPVVGLMNVFLPSAWVAEKNAIRRTLPNASKVRVRFHGAGTGAKTKGGVPGMIGGRLPEEWEAFRLSELSANTFLESLDLLLYPRQLATKRPPDMYIVKAMASGLPVLLPPELERDFGDGALYASPGSTAAETRRIFGDAKLYRSLSNAGIARAAKIHGPDAHLERLKNLGVRPSGRAKSKRPEGPVQKSRDRVLMFTQNGVGLGHVVRQLAISHHLSREKDVIFASMSQAIDLIEMHGYQVEHVPSHVYTGTEYARWLIWTRRQLDQLIDFYDIGTVVLDSAVPYSCVVDATAHRSDVDLVWIRRAMWQPSREKDMALKQEKFFDLVIEPADIAESRDRGPTVSRRKFVTRVDPITFLNRGDLRTRGAAARLIGFDQKRPAVLLQLVDRILD